MVFSQNHLKLDPLGCPLIISAAVCLLLAFQWDGKSEAWNAHDNKAPRCISVDYGALHFDEPGEEEIFLP